MKPIPVWPRAFCDSIIEHGGADAHYCVIARIVAEVRPRANVETIGLQVPAMHVRHRPMTGTIDELQGVTYSAERFGLLCGLQ